MGLSGQLESLSYKVHFRFCLVINASTYIKTFLNLLDWKFCKNEKVFETYIQEDFHVKRSGAYFTKQLTITSKI
jgi:hypothetical protein